MKIQPVIMSGGAGTRLWPMSRKARPKQFLPLVTENTMFQETVKRVCPSSDGNFLPPAIIAGAAHGAIIAEQLQEIKTEASAILLEPMPRNTAAVAAAAAAWVRKQGSDALILLMPADHHIEDAAGFRAAVHEGAAAAKDGHIVTFGIAPKTPHTGYGYIKSGESLIGAVSKVAAFKEKPTRDTAERYLKEGGYHWNAGIFLFSADAMLEELERHEPAIATGAIAALENAAPNGKALRLEETAFAQCPSDSIDYAVMERTEKAAVVAPVDVGWTDIGSWSELKTDTDDERIFEHNNKDTVICTDGPFVGALGVENLIVVATGDAVLIARRDDAQSVRLLVDELKKRGRTDLL